MGPVLPIDVQLPPLGSGQRLRALHRQLRAAIVDGRLQAGLRLPGTRALADALGVSRNSVVTAYDLLLSAGYVSARPGGGTFVCALGGVPAKRAAAVDDPTLSARLAPHWREERTVIRHRPSSDFAFDFASGLPDTSEFPFDIWRRLTARSLRSLSRAAATYPDPEGPEALRDAIASHVSYVRAVACRADDVVVTSGAQQAFDLLARLFVVSGRTSVAVEDPGYSPLRWAFEAAGARVVGIPVDAEGLVVEQLPRDVSVICVTPSHQFPMGPPMSADRRVQLLAFARRHGAVIVEDDYDGEFSHTSRPLDALQTLDRAHGVFYVGTFSKSLFPALRLGFVVTPPWARRALLAAKQRCDWHGAVLAQDTLAAFIAEGHLARHVRRMRTVYTERRQALRDAIETRLPDSLKLVAGGSGLHLTALLADAYDAQRVAQAAAKAQVRVMPIARFAVGAEAPNGLVLGVGMIPAERIDAGVQRLSTCLRAAGAASASR